MKIRVERETYWELVVPEDDDNYTDDVTERLRVPGGWIYKCSDDQSKAMVFVPKRVPVSKRRSR